MAAGTFVRADRTPKVEGVVPADRVDSTGKPDETLGENMNAKMAPVPLRKAVWVNLANYEMIRASPGYLTIGRIHEIIFPAYLIALTMFVGFPTPLPAMSNAVP